MHEARQDFAEASAYLCSLVNEIKPDLFHSNHLCYGALPVLVPRVAVAHGDLLTWWKAAHGREPKESGWIRWYRETTARGMYEASAVVAASDWMLETLRSSYVVPMHGHVINTGRNPGDFNPYVTKDDSVLSVGRTFDAASQMHLVAELPEPVPLCIVDSSQAEELEEPDDDDSESGETQTRLLRGPKSSAQMRLLYSRASIFVSASRYEPSGMAILEAALSRCALILNDIPALREIWGPAAVYFRTNDGDSLSEAVRILNGDPLLRRTFANRAFNRSRQSYNAKRMTNSYLQLYHGLVGRALRAA
jgi:glycosyltransferase involved in cell wall biosynthesis